MTHSLPEPAASPSGEPDAVRRVRPRPALRTLKLISAALWLIPALLCGAGVLVLDRVLPESMPAMPAWFAALVTLPWVLIAVVLMFRGHFFVRNHSWAEGPEDFLVSRGAWWLTLTAVPYGRIQYSTVSQGPLMRAFGLAKVELHSASPAMTAAVEGLSMEEAEALKEHLVQVGAARLAGL